MGPQTKKMCLVWFLLLLVPKTGPGQEAREATPVGKPAAGRPREADALRSEVSRFRRMMDSDDEFQRFTGMVGIQAMRLPTALGVPVFLELLDQRSVRSDSQLCSLVVLSLERYGPEAKAAVPKLMSLFEDAKADRVLRQLALRVVAKIDPGRPDLLPLLADNIDPASGRIDHTLAVLDALARYGRKANSALARVEKYLNDVDPEVAFHAYRAFGQILALPNPPLEELLKNEEFRPNGKDRGYAALVAVQSYGRSAKAVAPAIVRALNNDHPAYYRAMLIETLGVLRPCDAESAQALLEVIALEGEFFQRRAAAALESLVDPGCAALIPVLAEAVTHPVAAVRLAAVQALRRYGKMAAPALPGVIAGIKECDGETPMPLFIGYLDLLRSMGKDAARAGASLVAQLPERSALYKGRNATFVHAMRSYVLVTLADIGVPKTALPFVLDGLNNTAPGAVHAYAAAARAAGALGPGAREAVPGLLRALSKDFYDPPLSLRTFDDLLSHLSVGQAETSARIEAIRALAKVGNDAKEALPLLRRLARERPDRPDGSPELGPEAEKAIRAIQGSE